MADAPDHTELAYCYAGIAYDHQIPQEYQKDVLLYCRPGKLTSPPKPDEEQDNEEQGETIFPHWKPTGQELNLGNGIEDDQLPRALWVGMWSPEGEENSKRGFGVEDAEPETGQSSGPRRKAKAKTSIAKDVRSREKGVSVASNTSPIIVPHSPTALRVVVLQGAAKCKFYALATLEKGICTPYTVQRTAVYFFKAYRDADDSIKTFSGRQLAWNEHVKACADKGSAGSRGAKDTTRNIAQLVTWQRECINSAGMLIRAFSRTGDARYLKEMRVQLQHRLRVVRDGLCDSNAMMAKLFDPKSTQELQEAQVGFAIEEITSLWPDLSSLQIQPSQIKCLRKSMVAAHTFPSPSFRRIFLVKFLTSPNLATVCEKESGPSDDDLAGIARHTQQQILLEYGTGTLPPRTKASGDESLAFIRDILAYIRECHGHMNAHNQIRLDSYGPQSEAEDLEELWDALTVSPDVDSVKYIINAVHRDNLRELIMRDDHASKLLEKLIEIVAAYVVGGAR